MNQSTKLIQNCSKEIKSDNFCYRKVGRAITKWGAREKSNIAIVISNIVKLPFLKGNNSILQYWFYIINIRILAAN